MACADCTKKKRQRKAISSRQHQNLARKTVHFDRILNKNDQMILSSLLKEFPGVQDVHFKDSDVNILLKDAEQYDKIIHFINQMGYSINQ